jgi:SAM-dependent methyltransferase/uncharacterized protein YbaR (Trm112 family)
MRASLLPLLICPACRTGKLELVVTERDAREVRAGFVFCARCRCRYPVQGGIVDVLGDPPEWIVREQQGWLKLLGETSSDLDAHMLQLPYLPDPHWMPQADNFDAILEQVAVAGARVLDMGSGRGWSARHIAKRGATQVVACDVLRQKYIGLETADLYLAHDDLHFERVLCDMERLPFAPASFDIVFSTASLHHATDLRRVFAEVARVLRPGGLALIVNEPVCIVADAGRLHGNAELAVGINEHIYTIDEWLAAARNAGLRPRLQFPHSVMRAANEQRLDEVLGKRPPRDYLPRVLAAPAAQRLLAWQPLLRQAHREYELPLVLVGRVTISTTRQAIR